MNERNWNDKCKIRLYKCIYCKNLRTIIFEPKKRLKCIYCEKFYKLDNWEKINLN